MEFKYVGILFTSKGIIDPEIDGQIRVAPEVFQMLSWTVSNSSECINVVSAIM